MNKQALRQVYLEKRLTLTEQEYTARNKAVFDQTIEFLKDRPELKHIHLFMTIEEKKEVNTLPILDWCLNSEKHKVYLPKVISKTELSHHLMGSKSELKKSKWGILEPNSDYVTDEEIFDIVFIPLLSFDLNGNRLGYGAGFYDRFLERCKKNCLKVGLAITPPLDNIDYCEPFDVPLDYCITHLGINTF